MQFLRMVKISIAMGGWLNLLICSIFLVTNTRVNGDTVLPITVLESAIPKGAVCLDGSAPTYSYVEGYGNGSDNWIVFLQGGGMCVTPSECYERSLTYQGSSELMDPQSTVFALLDSDCTFNPHFCNWHKVYIYYCDGSSFMSDIADLKGNLYYRGMRIFNVMMEEMLAKGMRNAKQAILSGSSSGGQATLLHCDKFRKLFPDDSRVKCISDSGFVLHAKDLFGAELREDNFVNAIKTHELTNALPQSCTSKMNPNLCYFPEYYVSDIQTPVFLLESAFDCGQLKKFVFGDVNDCTDKLINCNSTELGIIKDFRTTFIKTLLGLKKSSSRGMFIHSCSLHTHFPFSSETWMSITLANKTIEQAIADWYFDRSPFLEMDNENDEFPRKCAYTHCPHAPLESVPSNGRMRSFFSSSSSSSFSY